MSGFNLMEDKLTNAQIAWRAAQDIEDGSYVNLGIGFPEMIAKFQPDGRDVTYHTENGVLGFGKAPAEGQEDWDLINAGKKAITLKPGASFFHHADSFSMVRGSGRPERRSGELARRHQRRAGRGWSNGPCAWGQACGGCN